MAPMTTHGDRRNPAKARTCRCHIATAPWPVVEAAAQQQPEYATDLGDQPGDSTAAGLRQGSNPRRTQIAGHHLADSQAQTTK